MNDDSCFNDNYERKREKWNENMNYKYCYIQGPKGDKGDPGPKGENGYSTIRVGETITGDYNTDAKVINVGTEKDAILSFIIPRGANGDDGDKIIIGKTETLDANAKAIVIDNQIGNVHTLDFYIPQGFDGVNGLKGDKGDPGPKGEMGASERIEILNTKTVDAGQLAEVKDDFDGTTHYLTFSIPKGEKGDNGQTGTAILDSYANLYEDNGNSSILTPNTPIQVELSKKGLTKNTDTSFTNTIRILNTGIYKIDYFYAAVASLEALVSLEVRKENTTINGTKITKKVNNQEYVWFNGSIITRLTNNEKIDLALTSSQNVTLTPGEDTISYLSIMKIDNS